MNPARIRSEPTSSRRKRRMRANSIRARPRQEGSAKSVGTKGAKSRVNLWLRADQICSSTKHCNLMRSRGGGRAWKKLSDTCAPAKSQAACKVRYIHVAHPYRSDRAAMPGQLQSFRESRSNLKSIN